MDEPLHPLAFPRNADPSFRAFVCRKSKPSMDFIISHFELFALHTFA